MFHCQVEYGQSERTDTFPCGKPAVAKCDDCGISICSDCREECCGDWFCGQCYDLWCAKTPSDGFLIRCNNVTWGRKSVEWSFCGPHLCQFGSITDLVRTKQESLLHPGMAAEGVANRGGSRPQRRRLTSTSW